ncbi:hypothetical protein E1B28_011296 [Marasmius oreades]|uniref:SH3 domain-containing protein n=1 Tax=Marasmius oreades TaxID=181124 RepID=A0A9P7RUE4_9AGAR|nr:uncharacterized protein E1B28_011296 [Marasmius oreades]KAG7089633.1 hypothetical protein E1B28_011296 [Marasmius oreades]
MTVTALSLDDKKAALLAHVVEQIEKNVTFLVSEDYLPEANASAFLSTLSNISYQQFEKITTRTMAPPQPTRRPSGGVPTPFATVSPLSTPPATPSLPPRSAPRQVSTSFTTETPRATPSLPATTVSQFTTCRAIWGFNENGESSDELSFTAGEIIEIVEESSSDWWLGRVNGTEGLFPSSYVDKLQVGATAGRLPPPKRAALAEPNRYSNTRFAQRRQMNDDR